MEFYMDDKNAQLAIIYIGKYIYTCNVDVTLIVSLMNDIWKLCRCWPRYILYINPLFLYHKRRCIALTCNVHQGAKRTQKFGRTKMLLDLVDALIRD